MQQQQQQQQQQQPPPEQLYPPNQSRHPAPNAQNAAPVPPPQPAPQQPQPYSQQQYPAQPQQYPVPGQHQVIVQTAPYNGGSCSRPYENYKAGQSLGLGITQVVIGVLCIIFNIVGIVLSVKHWSFTEFEFYVGYGIWPAFFFIIAGGFGIGARSKNPCPVIAFMVMSIMAAIMVVFVIGFSAGGIDSVSRITHNAYDYRYYAGAYWNYEQQDNAEGAKLAMHALMLILALVEFVVAIWSSAICCHAACCCRDNRGAVHAAPVVHYGGMQAGQQQVIIHTQGQQPFVVQQPQAGVAYPAGPSMAQPSASAPGMPPAYSAAGAQPPAYGAPPPQEKSGLPPAVN